MLYFYPGYVLIISHYQSDVAETTRIQLYLPSSMHPLYILRISSTASESSISSLSITATIEIKLSYEQEKLVHYTSLIWSNNQALDKITMQGRRNLIFQHVENTPSIFRCRNFIILKPCSTGELHHILTWICWFIQFAQNISRYI